MFHQHCVLDKKDDTSMTIIISKFLMYHERNGLEGYTRKSHALEDITTCNRK